MTEAALPRETQPWNSNDRSGFAWSTLGPAAAVLLCNALYYATGLVESDPAYDAVPFAPPGWLVGAIWLAIYPMWGAARWYARQTGLAGRRNSRWIVALMAYGLLYPLIAAAAGTLGSVVATFIALTLALVAAYFARQISKRAFWLIAPSLVWLAFAAYFGLTALQYA
ncbi:MAG: tryptophan-rich sensory protein [Hyphomonadaceae bacterium]